MDPELDGTTAEPLMARPFPIVRHPAPGAHLAVVMLEVVASAVDVDEDARERGGEDGGAHLVEVAVEIADKCVRESVGEGLEPGLAVVGGRDVGQGLGAVVGHAHQHRGPCRGVGAPDDRERPRLSPRHGRDGPRIGREPQASHGGTSHAGGPRA